MKKLLALIFLASISSPAVAMPAIFGMRMTNSVFVTPGVSVNSGDQSDGGVTTITSPGDSGDVSIDPNPIDLMPTLPPDFILPPTAGLPGLNLIPGSLPGGVQESNPGINVEGGSSSLVSNQTLNNTIPMPRGGRKIQ